MTADEPDEPDTAAPPPPDSVRAAPWDGGRWTREPVAVHSDEDLDMTIRAFDAAVGLLQDEGTL